MVSDRMLNGSHSAVTVKTKENHDRSANLGCSRDDRGFVKVHEEQIGRCDRCPSRTPFRPDPDNLQRAKDLIFDPPLDAGISEIVLTLAANGVETFESCEGGDGHSFSWPTVRFEGATSEGLRVLSVALENGLPVDKLQRTWGIRDGMIHGPWWEMTFLPPKDSPLWAARDTAARYAAQKND
jgi:hypothetical protein